MSDKLISEIKNYEGSTSLNFRKKMSQLAFTETAYYDSVISSYFNNLSSEQFSKKKVFHGN